MPLDTAALWELASLREQGVLTEEEFQTEKSKILHQRWVRAEDAESSTDAKHRQDYRVPSTNKPLRTSWQEPPENRSAAALLLEESHWNAEELVRMKSNEQPWQSQSSSIHRNHERDAREQYQPRGGRQHQRWHQHETREKAEQYHNLDRRLRDQERRKQEQERLQQDEERLRMEVQLRQHKKEEIYQKQEQERRELAQKLRRDEVLKRREQANAAKWQKPPPMVAVPTSPDEMNAQVGTSSGSPPLTSARLPRSATPVAPRSRSFDRGTARASSQHSPPQRSSTPTPRSASPTPRSPSTSVAPGPYRLADSCNQTLRKAEGQLRFDAHNASRHVRRQLMRVAQLIPIAQEAADQADMASDVAHCALSFNKKLHAKTPRAHENLQRESVRHSLRELDATGSKSAKMMHQITQNLKITEAQLLRSLDDLEALAPIESQATAPYTACGFGPPEERFTVKHAILTPGTLASPMTSHMYNGDILESMANPAAEKRDIRHAMSDAITVANGRVAEAQELCKHALQQIRTVRSSLINNRNAAQVAQNSMATNRMVFSRQHVQKSPPHQRAERVFAHSVVTHSQQSVRPTSPRPVTGAGPRWPAQPSHRSSSPSRAAMVGRMH